MPAFVERATAAHHTSINPALLTSLPRLAPPPPVNDGTGVEKYEVVVVGSGPAGIMLSVLLARYGITSALTVDSKAVSVHAGQADGLQPRTLEVLQSLDLAHEVLTQGCQMHEVGFWNPSTDGKGIVRTAFVPDVSVPARYPHEITIHQGWIEKILNKDLEKNGNKVQRGWTVTGFTLDEGEQEEFPVAVTMTGADGTERLVRSKYLVGADGAHSTIRRGMGLTLEGDTTDHVWGVMDSVVATTTFPDIRKRCAIHSLAGSIMVIPRERISRNKVLTRIYCQMDDDAADPIADSNLESNVTAPDHESKSKAWRSKITPERITAQTQRVLAPYTISFSAIDWWAAYQIGQRATPSFSHPSQRIHIAGDACHTHSPKAGQGMNVSMMDAYNLSFKLAHVLNGLSPPSLLETYQLERLDIARQLMEFDTKFSAMFSGQITSDPSGGLTHEEFAAVFRTGSGFTSGCGIEYIPSCLVDPDVRGVVKEGERELGLLWPGRRLMNVKTHRFCDANPRDLHDDLPSTGVYRILVLLPGPQESYRSFDALVESCTTNIPDLFPAGVMETAILFPGERGALEWEDFHESVRARCEWLLLGDACGGAYSTFGVDTARGAIAVVRPDGYVGCVAGVEEVWVIEAWVRGVLRLL